MNGALARPKCVVIGWEISDETVFVWSQRSSTSLSECELLVLSREKVLGPGNFSEQSWQRFQAFMQVTQA